MCHGRVLELSKNLGAFQFSYAVVTDTHVNFGETECNSEFEINQLANGRFRYVVQDLNRRDLDFVIHLGDLVHPEPGLPDLYERAAECFRQQVAQLRHPLHLLPGNHDVGNKPIVWGPGAVACDDYIALWNEHFGPNYHAFDLYGCRFFMIDSLIINSGLAVEATQKSWLEADMAQASAAGLRIFMHTHYPIFLIAPDEDEHFDNLAEPGRSWLLGLMERYGAEAQFSGHVHNFWYNRFGATNCYTLPSTAFVRQDYAEMYRATPQPGTEGGRSDLGKLGYFIVQVYAHGHVCQWVRTFGAVAAPNRLKAQPENQLTALHPLQNPHSRFGFDMRQNWLEVVEIPPSGSLDEFDRKRMRNDYVLMALVEAGVRRLRIPATDLLVPEHRSRLEDCAALGFQFTLFSFGYPNQRLLEAVRDAEGLIDTWEICHIIEELPNVVEAVRPVVTSSGIALYLSLIRTREDQESTGGQYHHMIVHGFSPTDTTQISQIAQLPNVVGLVFRTEGGRSPWQQAHSVLGICLSYRLKASLHIRMTKGSPGSQQTDDKWVAGRLAEAVAAAVAFEDIHVFVDTFADVDRGYYRRHGVVDRFYNPRLGFAVVRHLIAAFGQCSDWVPDSTPSRMALISSTNRRTIFAKTGALTRTRTLPIAGSMIDLLSGAQLACLGEPQQEDILTSLWPPSLWISDA